MVTEHSKQDVHLCRCSMCQEHPRSEVAREHRIINQLLAAVDERMRRLLAGFFARQRGRGGILELERISGIDRNTIAKGRRELCQAKRFWPNRIRQPGAGRKTVEEKRPGS
jgi:hypothetical protein